MNLWGAIGTIAGQIYTAFVDKGEVELSEVKRKIGKDKILVDMAVGWLAREGKAEVLKDGRSSIKIKILK